MATLTPAHLDVPDHVTPRLDEGDLADLMRSFNDVTARLAQTHETLRSEAARLEHELRITKGQLRRARQLAALGEMAAGIAHEIRNPLGSIKLYANILIADLTDRPGEQEVATKIASAVMRLNAVVGDVLTFSRDLTLRRSRVAAHELLQDAVDACADLWAAHAITLHLPDEAQTDIAVLCDPTLIHQALVNVMRNAAQAIAEARGPAGLEPGRARDIWLDVRQRSAVDAEGNRRAMVALTVRDSGPGIPAEVMGRLFNPFFTTRESGTGLGLAIVHRIVDAHGGRVVIENHGGEAGERVAQQCAGIGTTVELQLPLGGGPDEYELEVRL